jgi:hypothetical protein
MISIARAHCRNVEHWQNGTMALRWCAAGMAEAGKQFRRVNGHLAPARPPRRARTAQSRTVPDTPIERLVTWAQGNCG